LFYEVRLKEIDNKRMEMKETVPDIPDETEYSVIHFFLNSVVIETKTKLEEYIRKVGRDEKIITTHKNFYRVEKISRDVIRAGEGYEVIEILKDGDYIEDMVRGGNIK